MKIITVCGSMRFYNQMLALANKLTMQGHIVLLPFVLKVDDPGMNEKLQKLHRAKIDMSDEVFVVADGAWGDSTYEEASYAKEQGKQVHPFTVF
jgi:hypothetical protein